VAGKIRCFCVDFFRSCENQLFSPKVDSHVAVDVDVSHPSPVASNFASSAKHQIHLLELVNKRAAPPEALPGGFTDYYCLSTAVFPVPLNPQRLVLRNAGLLTGCGRRCVPPKPSGIQLCVVCRASNRFTRPLQQAGGTTRGPSRRNVWLCWEMRLSGFWRRGASLPPFQQVDGL
jgi:hypothetical protein